MKRILELKMSDDHSDGEGSGGHEVNLVDTTEDVEIELYLPERSTRRRIDLVMTSEILRGQSPGVRLLSARRSDIDSSP